MTRLIATFGGVGDLRPGPGTWGSLAALPLAWVVHALGGFWLIALATLAITALGWWAVSIELQGSDDHDPCEIVIDEVAGMFVALWPVSYGATVTGSAFVDLWPGIVTAFIAFRVFDIAKPGPVGWAEGLEGAGGVMADDLVAGWLASLIVAVFAVFAHLVVFPGVGG